MPERSKPFHEEVIRAEVSIKFMMPMRVASLDRKGPRDEMGKTLEQISQALQEKKMKPAGSAIGLLYEDPKTADLLKAHLEACVPISGKIKGEGDLKSKDLPKGAFACLTHTGPLEKIPEAYRAVLNWIEENSYQISGPPQEVYHKGPEEGKGGSPDLLIGLQLPVKK